MVTSITSGRLVVFKKPFASHTSSCRRGVWIHPCLIWRIPLWSIMKTYVEWSGDVCSTVRTSWNELKAVHAGIRIFDSMLFEDTVVSKIMEDFNTKCYVMNNAGINFIQNHPPPPGQTPGTRLEGSKNPPPGTIIVYKNPSPGTKQGVKSPTPGT